MKRLRDRWLVYCDLRKYGSGRLDAFLIGSGFWVYFCRRYPKVPVETPKGGAKDIRKEEPHD